MVQMILQTSAYIRIEEEETQKKQEQKEEQKKTEDNLIVSGATTPAGRAKLGTDSARERN